MARTAARSCWRHLASAGAIGVVVLATPVAAAAADEPVTGAAVAGAAIDPLALPDPGLDPGPILLLLVAGSLGLLGVLSGPEQSSSTRCPEARRARPHERHR